MAELKEVSRRKPLKMLAMRKTLDVDVASEHARTDRTELMTRIVQLEGNLQEVKGKLNFSDRRNKVTDTR